MSPALVAFICEEEHYFVLISVSNCSVFLDVSPSVSSWLLSISERVWISACLFNQSASSAWDVTYNEKLLSVNASLTKLFPSFKKKSSHFRQKSSYSASTSCISHLRTSLNVFPSWSQLKWSIPLFSLKKIHSFSRSNKQITKTAKKKKKKIINLTKYNKM